MNPPSENHSTVTDYSGSDVEKFNWAKSNSALLLAGSVDGREITRSRWLAKIA
jgi:hypothetical protein